MTVPKKVTGLMMTMLVLTWLCFSDIMNAKTVLTMMILSLIRLCFIDILNAQTVLTMMILILIISSSGIFCESGARPNLVSNTLCGGDPGAEVKSRAKLATSYSPHPLTML